MDINITFDERSMTTTFTDTVETGEVRVVVTYPDSIVHDLGKAITTSSDWQVSVPSRTDADGNIMQGEYSVLVERYDVGGTVATDSETGEFTLSYSDIASVSEEWDVFTPRLRVSSSTVLSRSGYSSVTPLTYSWEGANGTREWSVTAQSYLDFYDGGYYTGNYEWSFTVAFLSLMENNYVQLITQEVVSGTKTVKLPPMLEEIYALMGCLYGKMKLKECCKDASYESMKEDYIYASALLSNFILGGQAGNTTQLSDMLNGTNCQDGILTILKRWGCYDDTITETAISAYDFCLCDTGSAGSATLPQGYSAGNGAWITSDATETADKWTFSVSSGIGTFTQNLAGSRIFGGTVRGDSSNATHTSNGATNSFKLTLPIPGLSSAANLGYASALLANVEVWSAPSSNPTASSPWVKDEGSVQKRITEIASGTVSIVLAGIGATYPGGWAVVFKMPY